LSASIINTKDQDLLDEKNKFNNNSLANIFARLLLYIMLVDYGIREKSEEINRL